MRLIVTRLSQFAGCEKPEEFEVKAEMRSAWTGEDARRSTHNLLQGGGLSGVFASADAVALQFAIEGCAANAEHLAG